MSTFVFNPGNVLSKPASLRTCFFRFCSINPEGNGNLDHEYGVTWFLNLARSCEMHHSNHADSDEKFKLHFPFGHELDGSLLGTPEFPAMKVGTDAHLVLPMQYDGYSCGVGIAAGIAIVLNSLLGRNAAEDNSLEPSLTNEGDIEVKGLDSCFSSTFQCDNLEVHLNVVLKKEKGKEVKEAVCYFPTELFPPLPCASEQYLFSLKEQWFRFVNRLADLKHVLVPRRQNEEYQVSMDYEFTKEKLKELDWPPCGQRPFKRSDGEISESDDLLGQVVDPLGKDAADATKLFTGLAGNNVTATGMSVATKQLPADKTDVEDDDSVLPVPVNKLLRDIPEVPQSDKSRHLYFALDREKKNPPDEHVAERRYQANLKSSSSFVSRWRQPEHEQRPNEKASVLDEK